MSGRELLAKLRSALTPDMAALFGIKLDSARAELSEDATIDVAMTRIAEACHAVTAEAGEAALAPYRELGVNSIEHLKLLIERAKLGDRYRDDLVASVLSEGVRALGDQFDKDRWTRVLADCSIEDLAAFKADFTGKADVRLGEPGRQTNPSEPGIKGGFDSLSRDDQQKMIDDFRARTEPGGKKSTRKEQ